MIRTLNKKNPLLATCLAASIGLHIIGLSVFYSRPLLLYSSFPTLFTRSASQPIHLTAEAENEKLNLALEEVFKEILVVSPELQKPYDSEYAAPSFSVYPQLEDETLFPLISDNLSELQDMKVYPISVDLEKTDPSSHFLEPVIAQEEDCPLPLLQIHRHEPEYAFTAVDIPQISIEAPYLEEGLNTALDHSALKESVFEGVAPLEPLKDSSLEQLAVEHKIPRLKTTAPDVALDKSEESPQLIKPKTEPLHFPTYTQRNAVLDKIEVYSLPMEAGWMSWSKSFNIDFQLMPSKDKENYIFSLTLLPATDLREERINQNFYFLIDRSNSISKDRFAIYKKAVLKALSSLQEGDTFNISLFDQKVARLSETNLPMNKESLKEAEIFLEKQQPGNLFAAADLYKSLEKALPTSLSENDVNIAILLSDGESVIKSKKQLKKVKELVQKIQGNVSLYTATAGTGNNISFLNMLSSLSGGKFLYSDTHSAFPRRLAKLLLDLRHPISTHVEVTAVPSDPETQIILSSTPSLLYVSQPYTIVGTCDDLSDFSLVIEGKHEDDWMRIEKKLSFSNAKTGGRELEKKWSEVQAQKLYELFLQEGDISHLEKAQALNTTSK